MVGGHTAQRELEPIVAQFYAQRRELQQEKHDAEGADRLNDLYQAVFGHAREKVRNQLAEEFRELEEKGERLDIQRKEIADEKAEAVRERILAEEVRRLMSAEMDALRADQKSATERQEQYTAAITRAEATNATLSKSLAASETASKQLEVKLRRASADIRRLTHQGVKLRETRRQEALVYRKMEGRARLLEADLRKSSQQAAVLRERVSTAEVRLAESAKQAKTALRLVGHEARKANRYQRLLIYNRHELKALYIRCKDTERKLRLAQKETKEAVRARARAVRVIRRMRMST